MTHPYRAFARALARAWQEPGRFLLALAGMVGIGLMDPLLVLYTREVVDQYFMQADNTRAVLGVLLFAGIYGLRGGLVFGTGRIMAALAADVLMTIQKDLFDLKRRRQVADGGSGHLLIALLSEAKQSTDLIEKVIVKYIRSGFNLLALMVSLAYLQPLVALICLLVLLPTALVCARLGAQYEGAAIAYVRSNQDMLAFCTDVANVASLLRRLGLRLEQQQTTARGLAGMVASHFSSMYTRAGTLVPVTQLFLGFALVLLVYLVHAGLIAANAGTLAAIVTNLFLLHAPLRDLAEAHASVLRGAVGQRWVDTGRRAMGEVAPLPKPASAAAPLLEVQRRGGLLAVAVGTIAVVDGTDGTEIMRACESLMQGRCDAAVALYWHGADLIGMAPENVAATCFYADSAVPLYEADLAANVACDAHPDPARVRAALADAGLGPWVDSLAAGIGSQLGAQGIRLSGGQRQLLALARAFYLRRPVILLNDPTSALDPESERRFCAALQQLARTSAILICSHRSAVLAMDSVHEEHRYAY